MTTTYNIAMTEHFFNGITPFATGGQPFQVYAFSKAKVKAAESTCLLLMNFMVFMLVTNSFAALSLIYFESFVTDTAMTVIAIVGFTMNFLVLFFTFFIATSRGFCRAIHRLVDALCKFKLLAKFLEPKKDSIKEYFTQVQEAFSALLKKKSAFLLALLSKILSMGAYYSTTFFILKALYVSVNVGDLFFIICGTSFAITMVVFLPTPGSSGGIEFAFSTVLSSIIAGASAVSYGGMLIWRLLSYYLIMLVSLVFYIIIERGFSKARKAEELASVKAEISDNEVITEESEGSA